MLNPGAQKIVTNLSMYVRTLLLLTLILYSSKSADISVYRDVRLYGAKGDGITDDTQAIITALTQVGFLSTVRQGNLNKECFVSN